MKSFYCAAALALTAIGGVSGYLVGTSTIESNNVDHASVLTAIDKATLAERSYIRSSRDGLQWGLIKDSDFTSPDQKYQSSTARCFEIAKKSLNKNFPDLKMAATICYTKDKGYVITAPNPQTGLVLAKDIASLADSLDEVRQHSIDEENVADNFKPAFLYNAKGFEEGPSP